MKLVPGLYEAPITSELDDALKQLADSFGSTREAITADEAPHLLSRLLHDAALRALRNVRAAEGTDEDTKKADRLKLQVSMANAVLALLGKLAPKAGITDEEAIHQPPELLLALRELADVRLGTIEIARPTLPLRQSDLLVNGPRDLRIGHAPKLLVPAAIPRLAEAAHAGLPGRIRLVQSVPVDTRVELTGRDAGG